MKTINAIIAIVLIGFVSGCGPSVQSKNQQLTTVPPVMPETGGTIPVGNGDDDDDTTNTGSFSGPVLVDLVNMHKDLAAVYSKISMEIDLGVVVGKIGELDANYGGDITVHKTLSNGQKSYSYFTSGGSTSDDVDHNYWNYNTSGDLVWRGVFEGPTGTLVVVVDGVYASGDGNDPYDYMSGSLWFRKWPTVADTGINSNKCYLKDGRVDCKNPSGPLVRCWDVSLGPYDCRFKVSGDSQKVTAIGNEYTSEPYIKIAEFINLSKQKTFKEEY